MQGMIGRQITKKLQATIAQVPAVVLLGARQVGKTTLVGCKPIRVYLWMPPQGRRRLMIFRLKHPGFHRHSDKGILAPGVIYDNET
jgi:hypothetical protein